MPLPLLISHLFSALLIPKSSAVTEWWPKETETKLIFFPFKLDPSHCHFQYIWKWKHAPIQSSYKFQRNSTSDVLTSIHPYSAEFSLSCEDWDLSFSRKKKHNQLFLGYVLIVRINWTLISNINRNCFQWYLKGKSVL